MAQDWVMRVPLVHGEGNFGSVDGDPPAAYRYTEAKLTAVAEHLLAELRQETVDMRPNYDGNATRAGRAAGPVPEPARQRHRRHRRRHGDNIPPHNLGEVLPRVRPPDREPGRDASRNLLDKVKGPDFPLGGKIVTDRATLRKIYEEGSGSIKVQAEWKVEELERGKKQIVVTSIPYGVEQGQARERPSARSSTTRKLPQLLEPGQRVEREGRPADRPGDQAGHRPEPGDGVPLQAHGAAEERSRTT